MVPRRRGRGLEGLTSVVCSTPNRISDNRQFQQMQAEFVQQLPAAFGRGVDPKADWDPVAGQ